MIKLVYVVRARADIPRAEFHRYWLEEHGPRARSVAEAIRAVRYVQSHTIDTPLNDFMVEGRGLSPYYEGITELWWNSFDDLQAAMSTEEGQAAMALLQEDEGTFLDFSRSAMFFTEEHEIFAREQR